MITKNVDAITGAWSERAHCPSMRVRQPIAPISFRAQGTSVSAAVFGGGRATVLAQGAYRDSHAWSPPD
jgi:hypothetical protein